MYNFPSATVEEVVAPIFAHCSYHEFHKNLLACFLRRFILAGLHLALNFVKKKLRHLKVKIIGNLQKSIFLAAVQCQDKMFHLIIFTTYILFLLLGDGFVAVVNDNFPSS